jgi:DNA-binding transcriptional MerR regulator/methylmalonyl-CoA mutase cobalamin-binding subunit
VNVGIGTVEEVTGIARETLRAWERRYDFPKPLRSASGERQYCPDDVLKLELIRQLLNRGLRPHRVVPMSLHDLRQLADLEPSADAELLERGRSVLDDVLLRLRKEGGHAVEEWLELELSRSGLQRYILDVARPLAHATGQAWCDGTLSVFEEHIITALLAASIELGIRSVPRPRAPKPPLVLLATVAPEQHTLGLLMVRALLALSRAACLWVGSAISMDEIARCAQEHRVDVVALSFSLYFPRTRARNELRALRAKLEPTIAIWAGGACVSSLPRLTGVARASSLEDALSAIRRLMIASPELAAFPA